MKKFLLVVLAMVMLGSVQAQTSFKNKVEGLTGTEFYFGPKFGFNVASISDGLNTVDLSFAMGLSYDFNMGLVVSARYNLGLTNVIEKDKFGGNNQNRVFQLSAGWKF